MVSIAHGSKSYLVDLALHMWAHWGEARIRWRLQLYSLRMTGWNAQQIRILRFRWWCIPNGQHVQKMISHHSRCPRAWSSEGSLMLLFVLAQHGTSKSYTTFRRRASWNKNLCLSMSNTSLNARSERDSSMWEPFLRFYMELHRVGRLCFSHDKTCLYF